MTFYRVLTQRFLHTVKQDLERLLRCLVPIGTIIWGTKTRWATLQVVSIQSTSRVETPFCLTKTSSVSFLGLLSIFSLVYRNWAIIANLGTPFTARFCKFTTRSFLTFFKIKKVQNHSILEKISTQEFSWRANQNTLLPMPKIVLHCSKGERPTESLGKPGRTSTRRVLTQSFRFWWSLIPQTPGAFCFEVSSIFAILQDQKRSRKMKIWEHNTLMSSRPSIKVWAPWEKSSHLLPRARRRIISHTETQS